MLIYSGGKNKKMSNMLIHFCFLEGPKRPAEYIPEGIRPIISADVDKLGISPKQALAVCEELNNHKTIAAWLTGGGRTPEEAEADIKRIKEKSE